MCAACVQTSWPCWPAAPAAPSSIGDNDPWIYKKGPAFGMPGVHVDGMDVLKVRGGRKGGRHMAAHSRAEEGLRGMGALHRWW